MHEYIHTYIILWLSYMTHMFAWREATIQQSKLSNLIWFWTKSSCTLNNGPKNGSNICPLLALSIVCCIAKTKTNLKDILGANMYNRSVSFNEINVGIHLT